MNTFTAPNSFADGDDLVVTLSRQGGLWLLSWDNLTTSTSGSLPGISLPWLDAWPDLYFGVLAANAGFVPGTSIEQPFTAQIDNFSVTLAVPDPHSRHIWGIAWCTFIALASGRRSSRILDLH